MHFEEGLAYFVLAQHLPNEHPERVVSLEKAHEAFAGGSLDHWAGIVQKLK